MNPWMIPAISSIFGAIQGVNAGREMESVGRQERLMAEQNAQLKRRDLQEQVRRQDNADRKIRGSAVARAAASGATLEGTPESQLAYLEEEQTRELDWMQSAGASRIQLGLQADYMRADATSRAGKNQQFSSFFGGVTQAFGFMEKGGMFTPSKSTIEMGSTPVFPDLVKLNG
jgi:hypothetical protein